ncbi:hypothetical protein Tam1G_1964 [Bifidobacterium imperatoris]|uniref:Uncharacterized protein n=1 Tax=Bifidobacterium imperatoris TaxID=2020965 RepID=A0A2N5IPU9_9BIFI|nr:hypothetical protein Tam1G_1964 [Bifidobacterium imperatoris]
MPDQRLYMPRCKTCGPLGQPTELIQAIASCERHAKTFKTHKTAWYPTHARILVKGKTSDCE